MWTIASGSATARIRSARNTEPPLRTEIKTGARPSKSPVMVRPSSSIRRRMSSRPNSTLTTSDTAADRSSRLPEQRVQDPAARVDEGSGGSGPPPARGGRRRGRDAHDHQRDLLHDPPPGRDPDDADLLPAGRWKGHVGLELHGARNGRRRRDQTAYVPAGAHRDVPAADAYVVQAL